MNLGRLFIAWVGGAVAILVAPNGLSTGDYFLIGLVFAVAVWVALGPTSRERS